MIKEKSRISRIPERIRYQKGIHVYTDIFGRPIQRRPVINYTKIPMFPELTKEGNGSKWKEMAKSYLTRWLKKHKDTMKILKQNNIIFLFQNKEDMDKYLINIILNETIRLQNYMPWQQPKRLIRTDFVNPLEKEKARDRGEFYIEEGKGETTTLESYRLDTTTRNQLKLMEKWSQEIMDKQLDRSDLIRLAIHSLFKQWDRQVKGQS